MKNTIILAKAIIADKSLPSSTRMEVYDAILALKENRTNRNAQALVSAVSNATNPPAKPTPAAPEPAAAVSTPVVSKRITMRAMITTAIVVTLMTLLAVVFAASGDSEVDVLIAELHSHATTSSEGTQSAKPAPTPVAPAPVAAAPATPVRDMAAERAALTARLDVFNSRTIQKFPANEQLRNLKRKYEGHPMGW